MPRGQHYLTGCTTSWPSASTDLETSRFMHHFRNTTLKAISVYFALLAVFFLLVVGTCAIPTRSIEDNLKSSVSLISQEGDYPTHMVSLMMQDNFTDCVMLNIAAGADADHPVESAMNNTLHIAGGDIITSTTDLLDGKPVDSRSYARYWHGNQVVLRPLLCLTDYHGIRIINDILLSLLALLAIALCYMKVSRALALALTTGLVLTTCWIVPLNMQFAACFYVMLISVITLLLCPERLHSKNAACVAFFVIGAVTQYVDLLTTPLITLGLPLIVWCMLHKPDRPGKMVILLAVMWGLGYATLWGSKWLLASLITGNDILGDALNSVRIRSVGGEMSERGLTATGIIKGYWTSFASLGLKGWGGLLVAIIAVATLYRRWGRPYRIIASNLWLLLVAAMPLVWALVLTQHTYLHHFFTWRIVLVTIVALMLFFSHTITFRKRI